MMLQMLLMLMLMLLMLMMLMLMLMLLILMLMLLMLMLMQLMLMLAAPSGSVPGASTATWCRSDRAQLHLGDRWAVGRRTARLLRASSATHPHGASEALPFWQGPPLPSCRAHAATYAAHRRASLLRLCALFRPPYNKL